MNAMISLQQQENYSNFNTFNETLNTIKTGKPK